MRSLCIVLVLALGLGIVGCSRADNSGSDPAAARQAGRDAYRASQAAKRDAKDATRELEKAGKDFQQGWYEAKREDEAQRKK